MKVTVKYDLAATADTAERNDYEMETGTENVSGKTIIYHEEKVNLFHFLFCYRFRL